MQRLFIVFLLLACLPATASTKCNGPDNRRLVWDRWINEKTLPKGVEIFDRVWIRNPTATPLFLYTSEIGAEKRTGYRALLGELPTTNNELPQTKLVNGERYEYHFALGTGWVRQDYTAALIEPKLPVITPPYEKRLLSGKLSALAVKVPVSVYFGKKKTTISFVFEYTKNSNFGKIDPSCPSPTPQVEVR